MIIFNYFSSKFNFDFMKLFLWALNVSVADMTNDICTKLESDFSFIIHPHHID